MTAASISKSPCKKNLSHFVKFPQSWFKDSSTGAGGAAMLPLGSTCPPPVLLPTLKTGKFPKQGGAALARISTSGSLSPLQVPRPRPSAAKQPPAAGHRAFLQPSNPQLPPHSGHLTPWSGHCILARQTLPFLPSQQVKYKLVETYVCQLAQYWQLLKLP